MVLLLEERRLRPIIQALEHRQYAPALRELTAYLKKSPKSTIGNALKCLALEGVGESDEALKTYAFLLAIQSFHPLERLPGDEVPSPNGQHAPPADEDDAGVPESAAEQQTLVKVKQPAKKPKGKGKSSKPMPKTAAVGGGAKAQAQSAVVDAASRDEIYSTTVLNVLTRFLKSHDKFDDLATLYSKAWRFHPDEIGFGVQSFFFGGVRAGDWAETRKIALNLHQVTGDPKTLFWAAFAAYQEAVELDLSNASGPMHRAALLNMALSILWTWPAEPYATLETFLLFIRILRAAGKHAEALHRLTPGCTAPRSVEADARIGGWKDCLLAQARAQAQAQGAPADEAGVERVWADARENRRTLERDLVRKWVGDLRLQWERWEAVEELAGKMGGSGQGGAAMGDATASVDLEWDWAQEFVRCEDVIIGAEDVPNTNYKAYLSFITCLFVLLRQQQVDNGSQDRRDYLQDARTTLVDLADRFGSKDRAPILALLEINLRIAQAAAVGTVLSISAGSATDSFELIQRYWTLFGDRGCLFDDLKPYWPLVNQQALKEDLLARTAMSSPNTVAEVVQLSNALKVASFVLQNDLGVWNTAAELSTLYQTARQATGKYEDTDVNPADDLRLLEVHVDIFNAFKPSAGADQKLLAALGSVCVKLRDLLRDSPSNGTARILLVRLYRLLGCVTLLPEQIDALKMRSFQHETVLHIVTDRASTFFAAADDKTGQYMHNLLSLGQSVPISTAVELNEGLVAAFSEESYSQVHGMLELLQTFRVSYQTISGDLEFMRGIAVLDVDAMHSNFDTAQANSVHEATKVLDNLMDTRDWSLMPEYGPDDRQPTIKSLTAMGPVTNQEWLSRMRLAWMLINVMKRNELVDPELHLRRIAVSNDMTRALFTESELVLLEFSTLLCRWMHSIRTGTCEGVITLPDLSLGLAEHSLPWMAIQALQSQLETFAMLEVITFDIRAQAKSSKENPKGFKHVVGSITAGRRVMATAARKAESLAQATVDFGTDQTEDGRDKLSEKMAESRASSFAELAKALTTAARDLKA